jgi:PDZ domain-containing secreted protein
MINKLFSLALLAFLGALSLTQVSAQAKIANTKIVILEKEIDDNGQVVEKKVVLEGEEAERYIREHQEVDDMIQKEVEKEQVVEGKRMQKITKSAYKIKVKDENGQEKILEWDGQGEMPQEMQEMMKKQGMELPGLGSNEMEGHTTKKIRIKTLDTETDKMMEWDGEGEMPAEIKELLEKEGIDIGNLTKEAEDALTQTITFDDSGSEKKMKIIKKGAGLEEVLDLDWEGDELPDEVREVLEQEGITLEEITGEDGQKEIKIVKSAEAASPAPQKGRPQLGVMIEAAQNGVKVSEVLPNSSASEGGLEAGDVITSIDEKTVASTKDLVAAISTYTPGDVIKVHLNRRGQVMVKDVKLKAYVDPFPFKTWEQVMNNGKTKEIEVEIEKEVKQKKK